MTRLCEKCKSEIYKFSRCNYCGRTICSNCVKSSQKASNTLKLVICKECWSNMKTRKSYKNKRAAEAKVTSFQSKR